MSVRIVRTRSGEDIICDLYEVTLKDKEDEPPVALQLRNPYSIYLSGGMDADVDGAVHKISEPELTLEPWIPLLKGDSVMLKMDEVVSAYETHDQVIEKYNELIGAKNHAENSSPEARESE